MTNLHETTTLSEALEALPTVQAVSYEFPGYWVIKTTKGIFYLGDLNGPWGWDDGAREGFFGDTQATEPTAIAKDFGEWLELLENA